MNELFYKGKPVSSMTPAERKAMADEYLAWCKSFPVGWGYIC